MVTRANPAPANTPSAEELRAELAQRVLELLLLLVKLIAAISAARPTHAPEDTPQAPLVDKRELARRLGVSVATVDRLDREGQPHIRIGDAKRYDVAEVLRWHRERPAVSQDVEPAARPARPLHAFPAPPPPVEDMGGVRVLSRRRAGGQR